MTQADHENELLRNIVHNVEIGYVEGRPRHHHPSAHSTSFDPSNPTQSSIFVTDYADFVNMDSHLVQDIFRHRHILVLNAPLPDAGFSIATLKNFANVTKTVDMLGYVLSKDLPASL